MKNTHFSFARPEWLGEVVSTNDTLKERAAADSELPSGTVIAARRQVGGRGRMDSRWQSSPRGDIHFSFFWTGRVEPLTAGTLPMACALGVVDFLRRDGWGVKAGCKWPNDVLVGDGKICGILTEGGMRPGGGMGLVVGIGVNVREMPGRDAALGRKAACLEEFTGRLGEVEDILPLLLGAIELRVDIWEREGFPGIQDDLVRSLWGVGKEIRAKTMHGTVQGIVEGLGNGGELLLRKPAGETEAVSSVSAIEAGW